MKWVLIAIGALFLLVSIMGIVGALLSKKHSVAVRSRFRASPSAVFRIITDFAKLPEWRSDVKSVEILPPSPGGHAMYREFGKHGKITYEIVESVEPERLVARIADVGLPFRGAWTFSIESDPAGSRVTITERGEIDNPIFRFLSRYVFGQSGTLVAYLRGLGRKLGEEDVTPEVVESE